MAAEQTLILVKPDGVARGLIGEVLARIERKGFTIEALELRTLERTVAEEHYAEHVDRPFFGELVDFITSGPLVAMCVSGESAIAGMRTLMGATDPNDATPAGRELRLRQEYFFSSCSVQDIVRRHLEQHGSLDDLSDKVAIQLNDTHPAVAIAELMRLLLDVHQIPWNEAWRQSLQTFGYTNHTLMPEAPERWPLEELEKTKKVVRARTWAALYQGRPLPEEGAIFRRSMFRYYRDAGDHYLVHTSAGERMIPKDQGYRFLVGDLAISEKETAWSRSRSFPRRPASCAILRNAGISSLASPSSRLRTSIANLTPPAAVISVCQYNGMITGGTTALNALAISFRARFGNSFTLVSRCRWNGSGPSSAHAISIDAKIFCSTS